MFGLLFSVSTYFVVEGIELARSPGSQQRPLLLLSRSLLIKVNMSPRLVIPFPLRSLKISLIKLVPVKSTPGVRSLFYMCSLGPVFGPVLLPVSHLTGPRLPALSTHPLAPFFLLGSTFFKLFNCNFRS